ncbi:MAG: hypothetical protein JSS02_07775 [Planctomycetes bacterium]|nr:hypothetical protein [Planctomycetota bacterium]
MSRSFADPQVLGSNHIAWHVRPMVVTVLLLLAVASAALAQTPADVPTVVLKAARDSEQAPHGQGNVYAPCVLRDGSTYRMWYGGQGRDGHDRIHYAESSDGESWVAHGVALEDRLANHVNDPAVVKVAGTYYMYYTRTERDVVDRIDVAVSEDGQTWEPKGAVLTPGPQGSWDSLSVGRPAVLYEEGVFKLWYDGRKDFPPGTPVQGVPLSPTSRRSVGYATSKDGLRFTRPSADPVFGNDAGAVDVQRVGRRLVMVYESREGTRLALSPDGTTWVDRGTVIKQSGTPIDAFGHVTPYLLVDPDGVARRLYVGAAAATTWDRNSIALFKSGRDQAGGLLDRWLRD